MIYFCIPAHNEERTVGVLLWKIRQVMEEFPRDYQLLVMDDGSTDRTAEVLDPYTRVLPLTVLHNEARQGYAASLERLLRVAVKRSVYPRRDVVVTVQADFTDQPDGIPDLIRKIEGGADLVSGAPRLTGERVPRRVRWARRLLGLLLRRNTWPDPITDPSHGFRAYRVICLRKAFHANGTGALLSREGWGANAELLQRVAPHCRRIDEAEVAVRYDRRRRTSRFNLLATIGQFLGLASRTAPADGASTTTARARPGEAEDGGARSRDGSGPRPRRPENGGGKRRGGGKGGRGRRERGHAQRQPKGAPEARADGNASEGGSAGGPLGRRSSATAGGAA